MKHTLSILVENRCGELARIVELFSARGYNIDSLTVSVTSDPEIAHITLVTNCDEQEIERLVKRIEAQVRVLCASNATGSEHIKREFALISVKANRVKELPAECQALVAQNQLKLLETSAGELLLETSGDNEQVTKTINLLEGFGVCEVVRVGPIAFPPSI
jgi:acetolactate synthase-1/3 small subunit